MSKIAKADADAMNTLYRSEIARVGASKTAGAGDGIQAFADHKEYEQTLESVLNEDGKQSWNPNDPILD